MQNKTENRPKSTKYRYKYHVQKSDGKSSAKALKRLPKDIQKHQNCTTKRSAKDSTQKGGTGHHAEGHFGAGPGPLSRNPGFEEYIYNN